MRIAVLAVVVLVLSCASDPYVEDMMPGPAYYEAKDARRFLLWLPGRSPAVVDILYATDREPAGEGDDVKFYRNARGDHLRLGVARVSFGGPGATWEEVCTKAFDPDRDADLPLRVIDAEEFGPLERTVTAFVDPARLPEDLAAPAARFAEEVNRLLRRKGPRDVFIYVHGYRVVFENPAMVAAELWHFLGYQGAFISYAWPSTPSQWAYFADLETATYTASHLRHLLEFLAEATIARRIHVLGYSAGTRVVAGALHQLALLNAGRDPVEVRKRLKLGQVILTASDLDRYVAGGYLLDGILDVCDQLTLYQSETDMALNLASWIYGRSRVGERLADEQFTDHEIEAVRSFTGLSLVSVSRAESSSAGNGHGYFRSSAWVSSDVLATLAFGLSPEERGLVRVPGSARWGFPPDYVTRLRAAVEKAKAAAGE